MLKLAVSAALLMSLPPDAEETADRTVASCDVVLSPSVIGCRGTWTRAPQCPTGWHACTSLPPSLDAACRGDLGGFFASGVLLSHSAELVCEVSKSADYYALAGCGAKPQIGSADSIDPCSGFRLAVSCQPTTGFLCGSAGLTASSNMFARNGVLCCK